MVALREEAVMPEGGKHLHLPLPGLGGTPQP